MSVTSVQVFKKSMKRCGTTRAPFWRLGVAGVVMSIASMVRTAGKNLIGIRGNRRHRN